MFKQKFIGDKKFYKMVMAVALPIALQNFITNFVNMLDNLMVGRLGTEQMSGVAIVNQLIFVFNLAIFGAISGAGIYTSQFYGKKDNEGIRNTLRLKIAICVIIAVIGIAIFAFGGGFLIDNFLHEGSEKVDLELTRQFAVSYLDIILIGLVPFALSQAISGTLRETGETFVPMVAGFMAVAVNCIFNFLLIFGKFGFPQLGVNGAAIATVLSRYVELIILVVYALVKRDRFAYFKGLFKTFRMPASLLIGVSKTGIPLMLNEFFWSAGMTLLSNSYSLHGLDVVAAYSISSTVINLLNTFFLSLGVATGIIIGNLLGGDKFDEAWDYTRKLVVFSIFISLIVMLLLMGISGIFPKFYNTNPESKAIATYFIRTAAIFMPFVSIANSSYFIIRSGGKVIVTILFDSVYIFALVVPVAFAMFYVFHASIYVAYFVVVSLDIVKSALGIWLIRRKKWLNNIVDKI